MNGWKRVSRSSLPSEGIEVDTKSDSGFEQVLIRQGDSWFTPSLNRGVLYAPEFWRHKPQSKESEQMDSEEGGLV